MLSDDGRWRQFSLLEAAPALLDAVGHAPVARGADPGLSVHAFEVSARRD
jgi:hypothetical protein